MKWKREQREPMKPSMSAEEREAERRRQASAAVIKETAQKQLAWFPPSHEGQWIPWSKE